MTAWADSVPTGYHRAGCEQLVQQVGNQMRGDKTGMFDVLGAAAAVGARCEIVGALIAAREDQLAEAGVRPFVPGQECPYGYLQAETTATIVGIRG